MGTDWTGGGGHRMTGRRLTCACASLLAAGALAAGSASAAPVRVELRVEGPTSTIYEGMVTTEAHAVTTETGGTHSCQGSGSTPEATPTTALDDAAMSAGFTYDGPYSSGFNDYTITRIAETSETSTEFWGLLVNYQFTPAGGCQTAISSGEEVLWAFNAFNATHFLKLSKGSKKSAPSGTVPVKVTDGASGQPVAGATVGPVNNRAGATTNALGEADLSFARAGLHRVKASQPGSIRSNALSIRTH